MTRILDQIFDNDGQAIIVVFVGKSYRGKSYFLKYLISDRLNRNKFKFGLVFTTTKFNGDYKFLPDNRVIEGYNEEILKKYFNNLKRIKDKDGEVPPNFIIFDDLVGVLANQTSFFNSFITTCRHLNISVFIAVQYLTGKNAISPTMRQQTTHAIMFHSKMKSTVENLYENYGQMFDSLKEFRQHYDEITKDQYVAMIYLEKEDDINKNYFGIRAPKNIPELKFEF